MNSTFRIVVVTFKKINSFLVLQLKLVRKYHSNFKVCLYHFKSFLSVNYKYYLYVTVEHTRLIKKTKTIPQSVENNSKPFQLMFPKMLELLARPMNT